VKQEQRSIRELPSIPSGTDLRLSPVTLDIGYEYNQGKSNCVFVANTGNEVRVCDTGR